MKKMTVTYFWLISLYLLRFFAAVKRAAADVKSKVPSVSPQLHTLCIRLVTLSSPGRLGCTVLIRLCRENESLTLAWQATALHRSMRFITVKQQ